MNPDANRRESPLVVRVYELKLPALFASETFLSLFEHDGIVTKAAAR